MKLNFSSLRGHRNIVLFLAGQAISLFGSSLVQYAITWQITLQTGSGAAMAVAILCGYLPAFLIAPFAGVWADRHSRKALIAIADSVVAVASLVMALLYFTGSDSLWMLFAVSVVRSLGSGVQVPAISAFLPQVAEGADLTKVNAANSTMHSVIALLSPALGAALLAVGMGWALLVDVITAALAVTVLLRFVRVAPHEKALTGSASGYFADLREGIHAVIHDPYLRRVFPLFGYFFLFVTPSAFLTPLYITRSFGPEVWRLGASQLCYSLGMIAGGIFIGWWGGFRNRMLTMAASCFCIGVCTVGMGLASVFPLFLLFMGVNGTNMPIFNTPSNVILQQRIDPNQMGRVFGVLAMISSTMLPLGMLVFGPLADIVDIRWLFVGTGVLLGLQGLPFLLDPVLFAAGRREKAPEKEAVS